jgi:hypothetical protein
LADNYSDQTYGQILKTDTTWTALITGQKPDLKPRKTAIAICDHKHVKHLPHYLVWYQNHHFDQLEWIAENEIPDQLIEKYLENNEKTDDSDYDV